jgi:site-specific recombinase XerD
MDFEWRKWGAPHLRHTQATLLTANGVDIKTVQQRLGHSRASLTLDFYAHAQEEQDRNASALLGSLVASENAGRKLVNL